MAEPVPNVFLDSSSGERRSPDARRAQTWAQEQNWGDPLRLHRSGRRAAQALDQARTVVAAAVGARPDEVVFTPSLAHSAYAAVAGLALGRRRTGSALVSTAIDHSSVLAAARAAGDHRPVEVDRSGRLDLDAWTTAVGGPGVAAAALQIGNHEVGTLQPWGRAIEAARDAGVPVVLDASAALGRVDLSHDSGWSVLIGWAGAFGGPAGVGLLVLRTGVRWRPPFPVDDYQQGRWPGPPDPVAIHAAAAALAARLQVGRAVNDGQFALVDRLRAELPARIGDLEVAGDPVRRLPHLLTFSALYVDGEALTLELDRAGFEVASGSACSASSDHPSHVLAAMGVLTHGNVRLGLAPSTTVAEVERFLDALPPIVAELRARVGVT